MKTVVRYDTNTGNVVHTAKVPADYDPPENAITVDVPPGKAERMMVDTSVDPPELIDGPNYVPPENVRREKISQTSKDRFRTARSNDDLQKQLDVLFEILTGEKP